MLRRGFTSLRALRQTWKPAPMPPSTRDARRYKTGTVVALGITAVNGYIWYQWQLAMSSAGRGDSRKVKYMMDHFSCSVKNYRAERYWTLVTAGFSHIQTWHLLANSIGVLSFFPVVAIRMGVIRTTIGYLSCITGGSIASLHHAGVWEQPIDRYFSPLRPASTDKPGLGASAGVFGLFTYSMLLAPTSSVAVFFIPFPAWLAWGALTGVDLYCALSPDGRARMSQLTGIEIGHEAHLGGSSTALFTTLLLIPRFWLRR